MNRVIGTCSNCHGDVVVPNVWYGINPPVPTCSQCGATPVKRNMPVIDMGPPPPKGEPSKSVRSWI
jgi:hypothetical protein